MSTDFDDNLVVVGIGEALWDILPDGKKVGGAPANFAYHVSQFGIKSCVASAVGNDELGTELLNKFHERNLNTLIPSVDYPTGTVMVQVDDCGIPTYDISKNVAWDNIPFTDTLENLARHTRAVSFGSLAQRNAVSRQTIYRFLDTMPQHNDTYKIFDINLRQDFHTPEILIESMNRCNILKINDEELLQVNNLLGYPDRGQQDSCMALLKKFNLEILILTCGVNGSYVFTPDSVSFIDTPKVQVADTVGAGDSFTAAFVSGLLKGMSVADAHLLAVEVSAFVCSQAGAMPVLSDHLTQRVK